MRINKFHIILLLTFTSCRAQKNNKYPFENRENVPIEEIQEAISYNLEKAKYYNFKSIRIPNKYLKPKYFTETHRQRIIEILQNKWRDDELETHIKASSYLFWILLTYIMATIKWLKKLPNVIVCP